MAQNEWANYPLPPNFEMKYDFSSKRFFYIDHSSKKTTWEDPRPRFYSSQQHAGAQSSSGTGLHPPPPRSPQASPNQQTRPPRSPATAQQQLFAMTGLSDQNQQAARGGGSRRHSGRHSPQHEIAETAIDLDLEHELGYAFEIASLQHKYPTLPESKITALVEKHKGSVYKCSEEIRIEQEEATKLQEIADQTSILSKEFSFKHDAIEKVVIDCGQRIGMARSKLNQMWGDYERVAHSLFGEYELKDEKLMLQIVCQSNGVESAARSMLKANGVKRKDSSESREQPVTVAATVVDEKAIVEKLAKEFPKFSSNQIEALLKINDWSVSDTKTQLENLLRQHNAAQRPSAKVKSPARVKSPERPASSKQSRSVSPKTKPTPKKEQARSFSPQPEKKKKPNSVPHPSKLSLPKNTIASGSNPDLYHGPDTSLRSPLGDLNRGPSSHYSSQVDHGRAHGPNTALHAGPDASLRHGPHSTVQ